jgi:outer membrane protein assembly factor BamB
MKSESFLHRRGLVLAGAILLPILAHPLISSAADAWYNWRGPAQNGSSTEKYEKNAFVEKPVWVAGISGRGAPVIADGRVYLFGYKGAGAELVETLTCFEAETGKVVWEQAFADFLSDNAYSRYAIGSPTIDPSTGVIYLLTTPGIFAAVSRDGKILWQHSMMEEQGRLSFPNGRTGAPVIVNDLVVARGITANWGGDGPARDRLYAFQKETGELVWASTPGEQPNDSSFSTPYLDFLEDGTAVFYVTTGCGNYCCLNALTGKPMWRWKGGKGGINSSIVKYNDLIISIHDKENVDIAEFGRMSAVRLPKGPLPPVPLPTDPALITPGWDVPVVDQAAEVWRLPLIAETSSPTLAGANVYQLDQSGNLHCIEAETGHKKWEMKLAPGNSHSSPLMVNGLLYCPLQNDVGTEDGILYVIKPGEDKGEQIARVMLEGYALGAPAAANGKLYLATAKKFYCFQIGSGKIESGDPKWPGALPGKAGAPVALQIIPQEVIINPGGTKEFKIRTLDAKGYPAGVPAEPVKWETFIPPTAKVKSTMDAAFDASGKLVAKPEAKQSAGAFKATSGKLTGIIRGRVLPSLPLVQDFESFTLAEDPALNPGVNFAYPPLPWIGARLKFEVRDVAGTKALYKTLQPVFFQRGTAFIGSPDMSNYTIEADVMLDVKKRTKGEVGLINQRYVIMLNGNAGEIEVNSNHERLKVAREFELQAKTWYHLATRVDIAADGSGVVRAKAWKKEESEPAQWTIEVPHKNAHKQGAPGLFGFALQGQAPVYIDNIKVSPNAPAKK